MKKQTSLFLTIISLWGIQVQLMVAPPADFSTSAERNNTSLKTSENNQGPRSEGEHSSFGQRVKPAKETAEEINEEASEQVIQVDKKSHHSVTSGIDFDDKEEAENLGVIDTSDSTSGGNWLLKRIWGEKTEDVFSQIKDAVKKIMEMRIAFFNERNDIDKKFDQFYQQLGFEQGSFEDILNFALEVYDKAKQNGLSEKERIFYQAIQEKQSKIEQLKKDVEAIIVLDGKINDALDVLLKQIDLSNKYEDQAWENFRDILRELNDKEARIKYYETKGILDDVNKIALYLSGPFSQYFSQSTQSAKEHMKNILSQTDLLKKDGVDLKKEANLLEKEDEEATQKAFQEKVEEQKEQKEKAMAAKNKPVIVEKEAWWSVVPNFFVTLYKKSIEGVMSLFGGNKKAVQIKSIEKKEQARDQLKVVKKETSFKRTFGGWLNKSAEFFVSMYHRIIDIFMNFFGGNKKTDTAKFMPKKIVEMQTHQPSMPEKEMEQKMQSKIVKHAIEDESMQQSAHITTEAIKH